MSGRPIVNTRTKNIYRTILIELLILFLIMAIALTVIRFSKRRLSNKVSFDDIESVVVFNPYENYKANITDNMDDFEDLVLDCKYTISFTRYKWGTDDILVINYKDGKTICFGEHSLKIDNRYYNVYSSDFDFDKLYELIDNSTKTTTY